MSTIRITVTPKIQLLIDKYKVKYPLLDDPEIVKMLISKTFIEEEDAANKKKELDKLFDKSKLAFDKWLKTKGLDRSKLTEEQVYELIQN